MGGREEKEREIEREERGEREERERGRERERGSETPDLDLDWDNFTIRLPSRMFLNIIARTGF